MAGEQAVIRFVYVPSLLAVIGFLGDLFLGSLFYLRGEGLVLGDVAVIAAEFPLMVREIRVHEGDTVNAGEVAAIVSFSRAQAARSLRAR